MRVYSQIAHKSAKVRVCRRCGAEIKVGENYFWFKHRHATKTYFCKLHHPTARDMTLSDKLATLYETQDKISDAIEVVDTIDVSDISEWMGDDRPDEPEVVDDDDGDSEHEHRQWEEDSSEWDDKKSEYEGMTSELRDALTDLSAALTEAAENAREVADQYHESADNMEDGFGHETSTSEEVRTKGDDTESWADELESGASSVDDLLNDIDDDPVSGRQLEDIKSEAISAAEDARDALNL